MVELKSVDNKVTISTIGIKNHLKNVDEEKSICEYIWNGFDSGATCIDVVFEKVDGKVKKIKIVDNGNGIDHSKLHEKFKPFLASNRRAEELDDKHHSLPHGTKGVGRLTFFSFAQNAKWITVFEKDGKRYQYAIEISERTLGEFEGIEKVPVLTDEPVGTRVELSFLEENVFDEIKIEKIKRKIASEFCWFIELSKNLGKKILFNGDELKYDYLIDSSSKFQWKIDGIEYDVEMIVWKDVIGDYSCFYYKDENKIEIFKETTKLNKKGDGFNHSVFISSSYFKEFSFEPQDQKQETLLPSKNDAAYKKLMEKIREEIRKKRKPFLITKSSEILKGYEDDGIFPKAKPNDDFAILKENELKDAIRDLYSVEPRIFSNLNPEQKKIMVRLINLLLSSDERDNLFEIITQVVTLDADERDELAKQFANISLGNVIRTLNLISDRYKKVKSLKELLFEEKIDSKEYHVQELVEEMPWLFGEKYNLFASVEEDFTQLMLKFRKLAFESDEKVEIQSEDKRKQVDMYLFREQNGGAVKENMIVELKNPHIVLGNKQLEQIEKYANLVIHEDSFNGKNIVWDFILVGNSIDQKSSISTKLEFAKNHGEENGVILKVGNYRIVIKTWSEIFTEFDLRHDFINRELKIKRSKLTKVGANADEIVDEALFGLTEKVS